MGYGDMGGDVGYEIWGMGYEVWGIERRIRT